MSHQGDTGNGINSITNISDVRVDIGANALVTKSNKLIEAGYKLTLTEQQIMLLAVAHIREHGDPECGRVTITAAQYIEHFGGSISNAYGQLSTAVTKLYERSIVFVEEGAQWKGKKVEKVRWLSSAAYMDGLGQINFTVSREILPHVVRLGECGEFTRYRLEQIGNMTSTHAIRMYELLVQYLPVGTRAMSLEGLRKALGLTTEHRAIKDFKLDVLDLAMKQINAHTDLKVDYTQTKRGRLVDGFVFSIHKKPAPKATKSKPDTTTGAPVIVSDEVAAKGIQGLKNVLKGGKQPD